MKHCCLLLFSLLLLVGCSSDTKAPNRSIVSPDPSTVAQKNSANGAKKNIRREKVKIKKFFDFQCLYCKQSVATMRSLQSQYGKRLEIEYYHFPTKPGSSLLAESAECARDQEQFDDFFETYFTHFFGKNDLETIRDISQKISLDQAQFVTCLESGVKKSLIAQHLAEGRKYGVTAVPFFVIGDEKLTGSYPKRAFEKIIQHELTE